MVIKDFCLFRVQFTEAAFLETETTNKQQNKRRVFNMKKYKDFNEFMAALSGLVNKYVRHYKTDFTEYDIPRLKESDASKDLTDKKLTFIVRECGTWLIYTDDIKTEGTGANTIYNYYLPNGIEGKTKQPNRYYHLDLLNYTISPVKFDANGKEITGKKKTRREAA